MLYLSYVESLIKFGIGVWHPIAPKRLLRELNGVITECSRTITGLPARADRRVALHKADTLSLDELFTLGGVAIVERAARLGECSLQSLLDTPHDGRGLDGLTVMARNMLPPERYGRSAFLRAGSLSAALSNFANVYHHEATIENEEECAKAIKSHHIAVASDGAVHQKNRAQKGPCGPRGSSQDNPPATEFEQGQEGAGFLILDRPNNTVLRAEALPAGSHQTSYGAEKVAMLAAIEAALCLPAPLLRGAKVAILTDSLSLIERLRSAKPGGRGELELFSALNALAGVCPVEVFHTRGHRGIRLNEAADKLAAVGVHLQSAAPESGAPTLEFHEAMDRVKFEIGQARAEGLGALAPPTSQLGRLQSLMKGEPKCVPAYLRSSTPRYLQLIVNQLEVGQRHRIYPPGTPFEGVYLTAPCPHCA